MVVSSSTEEPSLSPQDILEAISKPLFQYYSMGTAIVLFVLYRYSSTALAQKYIIIDLLISSITGGYTVLSIKALSSLLKLNYVVAMRNSITYWLILVAVVTGGTQINYINKSLSKFSSTAVMPTNFVLFSTFSIIDSSVLYDDLSHTSPVALLGVLFMFLGVYIITGQDEYERTSIQSSCAADFTQESIRIPIEQPPEESMPVNISQSEASPLLPRNSYTHSAMLSYTSRSPMRRTVFGSPDQSDRAFKSLSIVADAANSLGTHVIRKLEIDALSEIQGRSPTK